MIVIKDFLNAVLDDGIDSKQLERLITPSLQKLICAREDVFINLGLKNLKKFETKVKQVAGKKIEEALTSEALLNYAQALVDLEKELIQADDLLKLEKVLKQFCKINIEKSRFQFLTTGDLSMKLYGKVFLMQFHFRWRFFQRVGKFINIIHYLRNWDIHPVIV